MNVHLFMVNEEGGGSGIHAFTTNFFTKLVGSDPGGSDRYDYEGVRSWAEKVSESQCMCAVRACAIDRAPSIERAR